MKKYQVIADFIDKTTGKVVKSGETFEADDDRAVQLKEKQLIGKEVEKQPKAKSEDKSSIKKQDEQPPETATEEKSDGEQ